MEQVCDTPNIHQAGVQSMVQQTDFYERYRPRITAIARRILYPHGNAQDIEDCVSVVFLELLSKADYDPSRGSEEAYISVLARSTSLNYRRKLVRSGIELVGDDSGELLNLTANVPDELDFSALVESIISRLNGNERVLFTMRWLYGYRPEEIAAALKIRRSAVDMRAARLKTKIQGLLMKEGVVIQ